MASDGESALTRNQIKKIKMAAANFKFTMNTSAASHRIFAKLAMQLNPSQSKWIVDGSDELGFWKQDVKTEEGKCRECRSMLLRARTVDTSSEMVDVPNAWEVI